ncbi:MAG TPA: hypothetical protein VKU89_05645 [Solirubrobacteraceae bacterium]|nr:hypothetical protein [Solirubrobacteraceae bacterium]
MPDLAPTLPRRPHARGRSRPRSSGGRTQRGVRWDRIGRLALAGALAAILYLYISAGVHLGSALGEEQAGARAQAALQREYAQLARERATMLSTSWIESQARRLGMAFPGEQQFELRRAPGG